MAGALSQFQHLAEHLLAVLVPLAWAAVVALHLLVLFRFLRARKPGIAQCRPTPAADTAAPIAKSPSGAAAMISAPTSVQDDAAQALRLFTILDDAAVSAGRAIDAHTTASRHLDSAEYQLECLIEELPMLAAARPRKDTAPARVNVVPAQPAQALAA